MTDTVPTTRDRRRGHRARRAAVGLLLGLLAVGLLVAVLVVVLRVTNPAARQAPGWSAAAALPDARGEGSGTVLRTEDGPRLAVVGGLHGLARTSDEVTLYDPATDRWETAPDLPDARHHPAAAAIGDRLYVTGGSPSAGDLRTPSPQLWALDHGGDGWERLEPMPQPRWAHRLVAIDGRLYAVGGQPGPDVQVYTPGEGWSLGAPIPEVRDHLGVVDHDGEIWALGGRDADDELTGRVDVYDPHEDVWRDGPDLPTPVSAAAVGVVEGRIHVVDGEDPATLTGGVLDGHWVLDPSSGGWAAGPPSRLPVHGAADGVIDGRLYVAGGASRQGALSVLSWTDEVQVLRTDPSIGSTGGG